MTIYRTTTEPGRCEYCGGGDIHTATCWSQSDDGKRNRERVCAGGCGLGAEPGDIFCEGCRDGHNRDVMFAGPNDR